jgi:hypothetical protein
VPVQATQRVVLFVDAQNLYRGARRAFFLPTDPYFHGQVNPRALGELLCKRGPVGGPPRLLSQVRIYTGSPDPRREPKTAGAHGKQRHAWLSLGCIVVARTLRYPAVWPKERAEEKGIDVALAVDYIALALDGAYDVGIIASTDTDLKPALEFVHQRLRAKRKPEVMAWAGLRQHLSLVGARMWCHWLKRTDFDAVADLTDYNR